MPMPQRNVTRWPSPCGPTSWRTARGKAELWKPQPVNLDANQPPTRPEWASAPGTSAALSDNELTLKVQKLLSRQGFDPGAADGLVGAKTRDAHQGIPETKGPGRRRRGDAGTAA